MSPFSYCLCPEITYKNHLNTSKIQQYLVISMHFLIYLIYFGNQTHFKNIAIYVLLFKRYRYF
jgi:hypothetical protein